jgi:hypothetical protein
MSAASPIRPVSWPTAQAGVPFSSSIARPAIPASSLPMPASLKNTAANGTASANSPELRPPCEPEMTTAPSSPWSTLVIESTRITGRPLSCATVCLSIRLPLP